MAKSAEFLYLFVEVDESLRAVDVVEGGETGDRSVDRHRVGPDLASAGQHEPVRVGAGDEDALVPGDVVEVPEAVATNVRLLGALRSEVRFYGYFVSDEQAK